MPVDYQEGNICKIFNTMNDDIYIGSTTMKLCERMRNHRCSVKFGRYILITASTKHSESMVLKTFNRTD